MDQTQPCIEEKSSKEETFHTTDRNLVVALLTAKIPFIAKTKRGPKTTFTFSRERAAEILARWQTGEALPVGDIRDVFQAEVAFNSAVHDEF